MFSVLIIMFLLGQALSATFLLLMLTSAVRVCEASMASLDVIGSHRNHDSTVLCTYSYRARDNKIAR